MNAQAYAAVRTAVQFAMAWLVAHVTVFAALPAAAREWLVELVVTAICVTLWTFGIRWLETRTGDSVWARLARTAAKLLMLGLGKQPVYPVEPIAGGATAVYNAGTGVAVKALPQ